MQALSLEVLQDRWNCNIQHSSALVQVCRQLQTVYKHVGVMLSQEELAEGLHLIDFEQLKIENQSLNEKIEERNEELAKLRKKTATTVQVISFSAAQVCLFLPVMLSCPRTVVQSVDILCSLSCTFCQHGCCIPILFQICLLMLKSVY